MLNVDLPSDAAVGALSDAVDRIAQIDLDATTPAETAALLVELSSIADRLAGEVARTASAVARSSAWSDAGATSPAAFVSNSTGVGLGRARGAIELGDAMTQVPALDAAVRSGSLSPAAAMKVVPAVFDSGFDDIAGRIIDEIAGLTPTQAASHVEAWRATANPNDDNERRRHAHEQRSLTFTPLGDGMTRVVGDVPDRIAQSLRRVLKHVADQQRTDDTDRSNTQRRVDALGDLAAAYERGEVTGGRNLPRVIVTMDLDTFEQRAGTARTSFGDTVTTNDIDRLCCDSVIHRLVTDQSGAVLNFGRGRRTASPQQFLALAARDRGCRHPGCDRPPEWCEAHHLREFATRGGLTNIDEMALLCHHHHHALHDGNWTLSGTTEHLVFTTPDGRQLHSELPRHTTKIAA